MAAQLTLRDFHLFHDVEPTEYVDELFELHSKYGHPHLDAFSQVSVSVGVCWYVYIYVCDCVANGVNDSLLVTDLTLLRTYVTSLCM